MKRNRVVLVGNTNSANGCMHFFLKAEVSYERLISSVNNDERLTKEGVRIAQDLLGKDKIFPDFKPFMSSEDFSVYQEKVPATIRLIVFSTKSRTSGRKVRTVPPMTASPGSTLNVPKCTWQCRQLFPERLILWKVPSFPSAL